MIRIVTIKFRDAGKQYDFNAQTLELKRGDQVVIETERGRALGIVVAPPREVPAAQAPPDIKIIQRLATEEDLSLARANTSRELDSFRFCQRRIKERKMEMKLVRAEYLFDGSKIIFYFTADGRVDFRELVKDLAHHFHTRIEMRQIGVRDEAKLTGGIGICGRELCCCSFLTDFAPVSVKMAKEQGLALNPNKISGQCGRLLCCLGYEFETYCAMRKMLPKCGRKVVVDGSEGEVVDQNILASKVTVRMGDGKRIEVPVDQIDKGPVTVTPPASPPPAPAAPPQPRRERQGRERTRQPKGTPPREKSGEPRAEGGRQPQPPREEAPPPTTGEEGTPKTAKRKSRNRRRPRRNPPSGDQ
jgi:cell fate regulator YaaT (PSP1 superfamily)